jgi:hypothetical protein
MADRDRKTLMDQFRQASEWLARTAQRQETGAPNRNCAAHVHIEDGQRAIAHGVGLLLSDKVAALELLDAAPADTRAEKAERRAERAEQMARVMMWFTGAATLAAVASTVLNVIR